MSDGKKKPSSRLLGMKFMQRSMEKEAQEQLEKERKRVISEAEWSLDVKETHIEKLKIQIEYQPSFLPFVQDTTLGRRSFNKFNKQIEAKEEEEEKGQRLVREEMAENVNRLSDKEFGQKMASIRSVSKKKSSPEKVTKKRKSTLDGGEKVSKKPKVAGFIKPE